MARHHNSQPRNSTPPQKPGKKQHATAAQRGSPSHLLAEKQQLATATQHGKHPTSDRPVKKPQHAHHRATNCCPFTTAQTHHSGTHRNATRQLPWHESAQKPPNTSHAGILQVVVRRNGAKRHRHSPPQGAPQNRAPQGFLCTGTPTCTVGQYKGKSVYVDVPTGGLHSRH